MPISTPTLATPVVVSSANDLVLSSASFTPLSSALILAFATVRDAAGGPVFDGFSAGFAHGGWTTVAGEIEYGPTNIQVIAGWCIADASPGSGVVTQTFTTVNPDRMKLYVAQIASGFDTTNPVAQSKNVGSASSLTSFTGDFDAAPAAGSMLIGVGCGGRSFPDQATPGSGWTELTDDVSSNLNDNLQYRTGTTLTQFGIGWPNAQDLGIAMTVLEIREPVAAGPTFSAGPTVDQITQGGARIRATGDLP